MTDAQLARLPQVLHDIVVSDRVLAAMRAAPVVEFKRWQHEQALRLRLREKAEHLWGHQIRGDQATGA